MPRTYEGNLDAKGCRFGLVVSRFNELITGRLLDGCLDGLDRLGANKNDIILVRVPGSFEIPQAALKLAKSGKYDAAVTYLQRGTELDAANPDVWYNLGKALAMAGQAAQAESPLRKAAELNPKDPSPHYQLARVLEKLGVNFFFHFFMLQRKR